MDKKGLAWGIVASLIITLVVFAIILGWLIFFEKDVEEQKEATTCRLSIIQAGSLMSRLQKGTLPKLNCPKIPVEIEGEKEEIMKELLDMMVDTSNDFSVSKLFSRETGRYCRRRYHPITFVKRNMIIPISEFATYIRENAKDVKLVLKLPKDNIDTSREYSVLFVADYEKSWGTWGKNIFLPEVFEERLETEDEGVVLIRNDKIIEEKCDHLI